MSKAMTRWGVGPRFVWITALGSRRCVLAALVLGALVACGSDGAGGADTGLLPDAAGGPAAAAVRELGAPRSLLDYVYADCPWQAFPRCQG